MSFLGPFVMTFFIVLFLLLMQFLWRYIEDLVGKGLQFNIIGELVLYASSSLVPLALPLAVLLSSLMAFGNMGEYYELTAIKSSGISLRRIMMPLVFVAIIIAGGAFFFANNVLPVTNLKMKSLLFDVRQQRPEVQITEGVFYNGLDNYSIRVNKKDPVTNVLYDVKIYDHSAHKGNIIVTTADSGQIKMTEDKRHMIITLWNGYKYSEMDDNKSRRRKGNDFEHELDKFGEQRIIIEMIGFELSRSDENIFKNSYQMLNVSQLKKTSDSIKKELEEKSNDFYSSALSNNYFKMNADAKKALNLIQTPGVISTSNQSARPLPGKTNIRPATALRTPSDRNFGSSATRSQTTQLLPDTSSVTTIREEITKVKPVKKIHDFDSLLSSYNIHEKLDIIRTASNYTSMAQYAVSNVASEITSQTKYLRRHEIEWHRKFTLSFACLIFLFIGAPLGAIIRKGGLGMPTVISTLLFILYYIVSLTGEKFVRESVLTSFQGMWLSSLILIVTGVFLTYQATNDSAILNIDTYLNWIREKAGLKRSILLEKKAHIAGKFDLIEIQRAKLQEEFQRMGKHADICSELLQKEQKPAMLFKLTFDNSELPYLTDFISSYNGLIDKIILSSWFRIPYFQKRLAEFPFMDGKIAIPFLHHKIFKWLFIVVFPAGLLALLHGFIKIRHNQRYLKQVKDLSAGMINLLNSSALKFEGIVEYENTSNLQ